MKYVVRNLELNKAITVSPGKISPDGTSSIYAYRSLVAKNNLEPPDGAHLVEGIPVFEIPAGPYLFAQGTGNVPESSYREAAEEVWLEALWQNAEFKNDRIFIRTLSEEGTQVYQIFREIKAGESRP